MHPPLAEIAALLARARADVLAAWEAIPPDTRERRLSPERWTAAEVLDHLRLVETGSTGLLAKRLQRAQEAGLGPETDHRSRLASFDVPALVELPRFDAPEYMVPAADIRAADAEAGLRASRADLDRLIIAASGLALGEVRARHIRFGEIDFYQWLLFIAGHEQRHTRQLAAIRDDLAGEARATRHIDPGDRHASRGGAE